METNQDPNEAYNIFIQKILLLCDHYFSEKELKVTTGIKKSSKRKQLLHKKFLKNRNNLNESESKNYKKLFEPVKQRAKKLHY